MVAAGRELRAALPDDKATVSCDGTCQRRGFASKNGVATVLSVNPAGPAKVVDVRVASNRCHACSKAKSRMDDARFATRFASHEPACSKNHEGSAGQMEPAGRHADDFSPLRGSSPIEVPRVLGRRRLEEFRDCLESCSASL